MAGVKRAAFLLACALAGFGISGCQGVERIERLEIEDVTLGSVKDGQYRSAQNFFPVTAKVRVSVQGGRITAIALLRHTHGRGHGADAILQRVLEQQSLTVDVVSGATYSSKVVLEAIEAALKQGL